MANKARMRIFAVSLVLALAAVTLPARAVDMPLEQRAIPLLLRSTDDGWASFSAGGPVFEPEVGIGPGTRIRILFPDDAEVGCTANYLWRDQTGSLYLGTAGHCLLPEGAVGTHGPRADFDPSGVVIEGLSPGCGLDSPAGDSLCTDWIPVGEVAYATQGAVGTDFGLIRLREDVRPHLRAHMPVWGGPSSEGRLDPGESTFHYGHGVWYRSSPATRGRAGVGLLAEHTVVSTFDSFAAAGFGTFGDSGSAVNAGASMTGQGVESHEAVGVFTHSFFGEVTVYFGTTIRRAKELASDAGLQISVVLQDEPL